MAIKTMAFSPPHPSQPRSLFTRLFQTTATCVAVILLVLFSAVLPARASDHQDTTFLATQLRAADLTDLYVFGSPKDKANVVLIMDFDPLIVSGEQRPYDPNVLYQFKIDNTGDYVEDLVLQFQVNGTSSPSPVTVRGPGRPTVVGTQSQLIPVSGTGTLNQTFTTKNGLTTFVGLRKDPFFFDLEQFFKILPDRNYQVQPNPGPPLTVTSFRPPGEAQDTLAPFNVHAIVAELPRKLLVGSNRTGIINVWMTTSTPTAGGRYAQVERLAVPGLNELFMDFQAHDASNRQTPTSDAANQSNYIRSFVQTIGRPQSIADAVISVAIPDAITADLTKPFGTYFGARLGKNLGGRRPKDDVIDVTTSVVFGSAVTGITQGIIPTLLRDNVGPNPANFRNTFPYLGDPR